MTMGGFWHVATVVGGVAKLQDAQSSPKDRPKKKTLCIKTYLAGYITAREREREGEGGEKQLRH